MFPCLWASPQIFLFTYLCSSPLSLLFVPWINLTVLWSCSWTQVLTLSCNFLVQACRKFSYWSKKNGVYLNFKVLYHTFMIFAKLSYFIKCYHHILVQKFVSLEDYNCSSKYNLLWKVYCLHFCKLFSGVVWGLWVRSDMLCLTKVALQLALSSIFQIFYVLHYHVQSKDIVNNPMEC